MKINFSHRILFLIIPVIFVSCEQEEDVITIKSLLSDMVSREKLAQFPNSNFRLKQQSSYNRVSKTPTDSVSWFINKDFNSNEKDHNFIRIEEKNGEKEWGLMEHSNPGAIVRTWMPFKNASNSDTNSIIKFYLDGSDTPALEGNMFDLLNGTGLIPFPLAHKSLRSAVSFFPIPYAKSCKVTVTERPFFFQFTYREYPATTKVKSFNLKDFKETEKTIETVCTNLLNPAKENKEPAFKSYQLAPNKETKIELPKGGNALKKLIP